MTQRNPSADQDIQRNTKHAGSVVLEEIQRSENLPATVSPEQAFTAVMCGLQQALGGDAAQQLERGLPASIRKLVARCEVHAGDESQPEGLARFLERVSDHLELDETQAQELSRLVFHSVHRLMSVGEVEDVARDLPEDLRSLWRAGDDAGDSNQSSRLD